MIKISNRSPKVNLGTRYHGQLYLEGDHIMHVSGRPGCVGPEEDGDVGEDVLEGGGRDGVYNMK